MPSTNSTNVGKEENGSSNFTSFIPCLPNARRELQAIKDVLQIEKKEKNILSWPKISSSLGNEYNTEGLFSMAFLKNFSTGATLPLQPRNIKIHLHEYALHLTRYFDHRFGKHVRFRYFLYNLIMRHCNQQNVSIFVRAYLEDKIPSSLTILQQQLQVAPHHQLAEQLMQFGASLCGTHSFQSSCRVQLTAMIEKLGIPTLFFTLSFANTKWANLQKIFSSASHLAMEP